MFNQEMMLLLSAGSEGNLDIEDSEPTECEISEERIVRFATETDTELTSAVIFGTYNIADGRDFIGIGYPANDGSFRLDVRIHGKNFLDGRELARLIECESGRSVDEYDDEHFIYRAEDTAYTLISSDHLALPSVPCNMAMVGYVADAEQRPLIPGFSYEGLGGSKSSMSCNEPVEGYARFTMKTPSGSLFRRFVHKKGNMSGEIPILYELASLCEGVYPADEPFIGSSVCFTLGDLPLIGDEEIADELDILNGVLTRRFGSHRINADEDITEAIYMGHRLFKIRLPERARNGMIRLGDYGTGSFDEALEFGELGFLSPTGECIYFRLFDDSTLDDVRSELDGVLMIYPLVNERTVELGAKIDPEIPAGLNYIEVCSTINSPITIRYKEKE